MTHLYSLSNRLEHNTWFVIFWIVSLVPFWTSLSALARLSLQDDKYSHVLLIPLMVASLVYLQRKRIFSGVQFCVFKGAPLLIVGIVLFCLAQTRLFTLNSNDHLSVVTLAIILVWIGGFVLCFGAKSFRAARFPLLFLLLMIPIPTAAMDKTIVALQAGSALMTYALFKVLGIPVLWQGFKFSLPGVEIEIAEECSGLRSSLALFITSVLAGHMFLQSGWRKTLFTLLTVPVVIFKNAVRIVTISCLGVYVDPGFLHGRLHRYGGLPFSIISLAILISLLFALQEKENHRNRTTTSNLGSGKAEGHDPTPLAAHTETA